jgi:hypothetical protein
VSNNALKSTVETVSANTSNANGQAAKSDEGPATIRYKGISITPGGFIEAATITRTRAASADINPP